MAMLSEPSDDLRSDESSSTDDDDFHAFVLFEIEQAMKSLLDGASYVCLKWSQNRRYGRGVAPPKRPTARRNLVASPMGRGPPNRGPLTPTGLGIPHTGLRGDRAAPRSWPTGCGCGPRAW